MKKKSKFSELASELGKMSHKKSPRSKEFYSKMGKAGAKNRWGKKSA